MCSTRRRYLALGVGAITALAIITAHAVDQPISAIKLILKISPSGSQKMVFVAKDPAFLFPALGGPNDPANGSPGGAIIDILTRDGGDVTFTVPPGESSPPGWKAKDGASTDLYKYVNKDAPGGPTELKVVVLKETKVLKLVGKSAGLPLTGTLGDVVVRVTTGSLRNCARFDASVIRRDEPGKFIAKGALASALTDCVNGPPTTTTSTTTSTSTSTSTSSTSTTSTSSSSTTTTSTSSTTTTSTSSSSTTTTSTSSTTTTSLVLEFTTGTPDLATQSGLAKNGGADGSIVKVLHVGGLNIGGGCYEGGGACGILEGPTPGGATNTFKAACVGTSCTISERTAAESGSPKNCSDTGCSFGTFLPISNTGTSTCVRNVYASPASGTLDLTSGAFTGSFPLTSNTTLTGNGASPCPLCLGGTPGVTNSGNCDDTWVTSSADHSSTEGDPCTPTDSVGSTYDCIPAGLDLGGLSVDLTPIATGTVSEDTAGVGDFCPGQDATEPGSFGCFDTGSGATLCDYIEETGVDAAGISIGGGPVASQLVSIFCIPPVGGIFGGLINGAADLPGPGATSLPGTLELIP